MKLSGVRPSVRPSVPSFARRGGGFAAERRASMQISIYSGGAGRPAAAARCSKCGSAT